MLDVLEKPVAAKQDAVPNTAWPRNAAVDRSAAPLMAASCSAGLDPLVTVPLAVVVAFSAFALIWTLACP